MPQKRIVCHSCKQGSMVWIGIGQEVVDCPKCGGETPSTSAGVKQKPAEKKPKTSSARKTTTKKPSKRQASRSSKDTGKLFVPSAQSTRLINLLAEISHEIARSSHLAPLKSFDLKKSKITYVKLQSFHDHVLKLKREGQKAADDLSKLQGRTIIEITALKDSVKAEGVLFRNVRKITQSVSGEQTTEKEIKALELLKSDISSKMTGFHLILTALTPLEKYLRTALSTPAAKKWQTVPNLTLSQLEKEKVESIVKSESSGATSKTAKKGTSTKKQVGRSNPDFSDMDKLDILKSLYPELAKDLAEYHRKNKSPKSRLLHSATGVWFLGQSWLTFFDGEEFDATDDIRIYNLISEMARRSPKCSVEDEASIFMHNIASNMTEFEMRLGLCIAVKKLGHVLILNGNFDHVLASLIRYRDRTNFELIGK